MERITKGTEQLSVCCALVVSLRLLQTAVSSFKQVFTQYTMLVYLPCVCFVAMVQR